MSVLRGIQPLVRRQAPRLAARATIQPSLRRTLNTETAPALYSARAKVVGARTGHVEGDDLVVDLTMSKALGGEGEKGKTNPEELFAAGYGACFQSAMNASGASLGIKMPTKKEDSIVDTTVHLIGDMKKLDLGIRVDMKIQVRGIDQKDLDKLIAKTQEVCPYSRATQGNITTNIEATAI
jgi:Ohr subfamily peroxiredoxin